MKLQVVIAATLAVSGCSPSNSPTPPKEQATPSVVGAQLRGANYERIGRSEIFAVCAEIPDARIARQLYLMGRDAWLEADSVTNDIESCWHRIKVEDWSLNIEKIGNEGWFLSVDGPKIAPKAGRFPVTITGKMWELHLSGKYFDACRQVKDPEDAANLHDCGENLFGEIDMSEDFSQVKFVVHYRVHLVIKNGIATYTISAGSLN